MKKKFDIHEWQAKYLFEQRKFQSKLPPIIHNKHKNEIEVTGMEPDSGNMEKEFKVLEPESFDSKIRD